MGWISPVTLSIKMLLQSLWQHKLEWDEPIPPLIPTWKNWASELPNVSSLPIPRRYTTSMSEVVEAQLHAFADASQKGCGGVVYLRLRPSDTTISIAIVTSKMRVAPLGSPLTIPKLELSAALLTARLLKTVGEDLNINSSRWYCGTDSAIVLGWLYNSSQVASFRVESCLSDSKADFSLAMETRSNYKQSCRPCKQGAYCFTAYRLFSVVARSTMAPLAHLEWRAPMAALPKTSLPEASARVLTASVEEHPPESPWRRFSSFCRAVRTFSWVRRFACNGRLKQPSQRTLSLRLSTQEIEDTTVKLTCLSQQESFPSARDALY